MNNRRTFIWKFGAGASAALVSTAGMMPKAEASTTGNPALRADLLEEEKALVKFHQAFEQAMDKGLHEEVVAMFADDAEVVFNGGVFKNRSHGVSRLYRDRFPAGKSGRRMEPAPGFELSADQQRDSVEVSPDLQSAKAVFPYSIQVGTPFETETSLAAMLFGVSLLLMLRVLGVMKSIPFSGIHRLLPFAIFGFVINVFTGMVL